MSLHTRPRENEEITVTVELTPTTIPSVPTFTKVIIGLLKLIKVDLISFDDINEGEIVLGYDMYYGLAYKSSTGMFKIQADQV